MKMIGVLICMLIMVLPLGLAVNFSSEPSSADKATFDQILEPIMKIYNFVKYAATALAVLFLIFAGATFIMSGNDQAKREQAKMMAMYIVIGLVIIWVAPLMVSFLTQ